MEYSPISSMRVKNFRNIGDITLDFKDSPIITLVGENESGKTSIIKALVVAGLNGYPTRQKKYIRQGTTGFGIGVALEDGTSVMRIKTNTSNSLTINHSNGETWQVNKIDLGEIPVELQNVMGLIEEPETKELIQVRTYENQLLFVVTNNSTNYKVMYNALKIDQISKAIKLGTDEVNKLKQRINTNELVCNGILDKIRNIRLVDTEPLSLIKDRLRGKVAELAKLEDALHLKHKVEELRINVESVDKVMASGIGAISESLVDKLSIARYRLCAIRDLDSKISRYRDVVNVPNIDYNTAIKLQSAMDRLANKRNMESQLGSYVYIGNAKGIDLLLVSKVGDLIGSYRRLKECEDKLSIYKGIESIGCIKEDTLNKLDRAIRMYVDIQLKANELSAVDTSNLRALGDNVVGVVSNLELALGYRDRVYELYNIYNQINTYIVELNNKLRDSGAVVSTCPNCGEDVVVDIHKYDI